MAEDLALLQPRADKSSGQRAAPAAGLRGRLRGFARRHWIALTVVAVLVLAYTLAGFFLVPYLGRTMAQDYVARELGRHLVIREARYNPFTLQAIINGLELTEADGSQIATFKSLRSHGALGSFLLRGVVLKDVTLEDPVVKVVVLKDGSVNLAKLIPSRPETPAPQPQSPPRFHIGELFVGNGRVDLEDRTQAKPFSAAIEKIQFALSDFRMDLDYKNAFAFSAATPANEQFEWSGSFTVQPLGSTGKFSVQNLRAQTLDDELQERLPVQLASGTVSLTGEYQIALDPKLQLDLSVPSITLRDLKVKERSATAQEVPLSVPQVDVSGVALSLAARTLAIKEVSATGVHVDVRREKDGSINLTRLFAGEKSSGAPARASSAAPTADGGAFKVGIDTIRLADGAAIVEDRGVAPAARFELKPMALTVNGWSTDPTGKIGVEGDITINQHGRLQVKGETRLEPLSADVAVKLVDFALPVLQPYIADLAALTLHSGRLGVTGQATYAAASSGAPAIRFIGALSVADLRTTDNLINEDLAKWKDLSLAGIDFSSSPDKLTIDRVTVTQPYARVVIAKDQTLNVAKLLKPQAETGKQTAQRKQKSDTGPAFPVRINNVRIVDGSANFADYSIEPQFATGIAGLNGSVVGLSSNPASRAKVKLEGKVDKYAPVDISGELNLLAATKYTDVALNFRNIELTTFNPYSGKFAGYNISKGKLTTELKYKVDNRALVAEHHVIVDNLEFGEKTESKDAAPIPVKFAVALLKDRKGIIDLNLPVRGSLDDPQFRLGPIIWKAVLGLLTKIVTAPFAALGALFGGGDELAYVDFPAGASTLSAAELEKLEKLAKALGERPQIRLDVPHSFVGALDGAALARNTLQQRAPPATTASADAAAKRKRLAQLEAVYKQVAKVAPAYPPELKTASGADPDARLRWIEAALLERLQPDQATLDALGRERAQVVQDTLLAHKEIDPQRIFITTERKASAPSDGTVRMEMKIE